MGLPTLDYGNYLHVFSSTKPSDLRDGATFGITYTATQDCYLSGSMANNGTKAGNLYIDGTKLAYVPYESSGSNRPHQQFHKLSQGDVVEFDGTQPTMWILPEK